MQYLTQILRKIKWPERAEVLQIDLETLEHHAGMMLPPDYRHFVTRFHGFEMPVGKEYINLWPGEKLLSVNEGYHIFEQFSQTLAIGDNGAGEWIGIEEQDNSRPRIILSPFVTLNSRYHIAIATSFTDFVERLSEGEELI
jgi:hypothetical protein